MSFSLPGHFGAPMGGRPGPSSRRGDANKTNKTANGRGGANPNPSNVARSLVTLAAAAGGGAGFVASTPQGKNLARRALLAGGAAIAPAQEAFAKKVKNPSGGGGGGGGGSGGANVEVPKPVTKVDLDGRRLVAIGDVHGDFLQSMKALELAKVMDKEGNWIGGTTVLVQVGDILDRGDSEIAIMIKFRKLAKQAKEAGGDVITINGNHEIMNVLGDFRYATKGAYAEDARYVEKQRAKLVAAKGEENVAPLPKAPEGTDQETFAGIRARQQLFLPGGEMAMKMASNPTVLQVGDTVFAHAGITEVHVDYGFERLNDEVAAWMAGKTAQPPKHVLEEKGVVWTRDYGGADAGVTAEASACRRLSAALEATGAKRLVVGHTPQQKGINSGCNGKVWRTDVGVSRGIYGNAPQVIEIIGGKVRVLAA